MLRAAHVLGLPTTSNRSWSAIGVVVMLSFSLLPAGQALALGTLSSARVGLSDTRPSAAAVDYTFTGSSVDGATAIACVKVVWSTTGSNDIAPAGFSGASGGVTAASSTLINSSATSWSLAKSDGASSSGQNNIYQYTNSGGGVTPGTTTNATFVVNNITNPSTPDTNYYFSLKTYTNTNCSAGLVNSAQVEFINTRGSQVSLTVDPTLTFAVNAVTNGTSCDGTAATADSTSVTIPFGNVNSVSNAVVCQDLTASSNATNGYTIYLRYTGAPTNGAAQTIADLGGGTPTPNSAPTTFSAAGSEAYGYATDDATLSTCGGSCSANRFTSGGQKWAAATTTNAEVGYEPAGGNTVHYMIGHQVGVSTLTNPGTYLTTVIYTCTPVF